MTTAAGTSGLGEPKSGNDIKLDLYLLYDDTTTTYMGLYGDAICIGISPVTDIGDSVKVTYSFQGTSALAVHDDAAADHSY